jgi:predicted O-methyltransferase YrrM
VSDELVARSAPNAFRQYVAQISTLNEAVAMAVNGEFEYYDVHVRAQQRPTEIITLLDTLAQDAPRRILEIGTAEGGTLFLFTRIATPDATIVSVDLDGNGYGVSYPARHQRLYRAFARDSQTLHLVRGDSHDPGTVARIRRLLISSVDFLFIDGDHSYHGVRRDYELYSPLVKPGGIIAFHDIVPAAPDRVGEVPRFWAELRRAYSDSVEYVESWSQPGYGIGVIRRAV